jgi:GTP-binding protein
VIDAAGTEGRDPLADFETINTELGQYSAELTTRPQIVAANKMDLPDARQHWPRLRAAFEERDIPAYPVSAASRDGLEPLLRAVAAKLAEVRRDEAERAQAEHPTLPPDFAAEPDHVVYSPPAESKDFTVRKLSDGFWRVGGKAIERTVAMTDFTSEGAQKFFQVRLRQMGITQALEQAGARAGDTVRIGDVELEWLAPITPPPPRRRTAHQRKLGQR